MPPTLGLVASGLLVPFLLAVGWWNRANQRIDATRATLPAEEYSAAAEAERILREVS